MIKIFTRLFTIFFALAVATSCLKAQNTLMTKARMLGLKANGIHHQSPRLTADNSRIILLKEGFDTDWLPNGWSVINTNPTNNWEQTNPAPPAPDFSIIDANSLFSAMVEYIAEDQDEWLITPQIDAGGETPLNLTWYAGVSGPWLSGATLRCLITTNDGVTWLELWNAVDVVDPNADWAWNLVTINLDDYAGTPFKIAWNYVGNDGDLAGVDGVKISAGYNYLYKTNFEDYYSAGDMVALNDTTGFWTTWDNTPGSNEDAPVVNTRSSSAPNSAEIVGTTTDLIFKMGNKTSGKYMINFKYYIVGGNGGYFNFQHYEEPGIQWAFEVYFGATGNGFMHAGMQNAANFTYSPDTWMQLSTIVDIAQDSAWFYIDGNLIYQWPFHYQADDTAGVGQLGAIDFYAGAPSGETAHYFLDDMEFIELGNGVGSPVINIDDHDIIVHMEQGGQTTETFPMGNTGQQDLDYQIVTTYPQDNHALNSTPAGMYPQIPRQLNDNFLVDPDALSAVKNPSTRDDILHYDGDNLSAIGNNNSDYEWRIAAMFPADMLAPYIGMEIYKVDVYINDLPIATKLQIYGMGSFITGQPGNLLMEQDFTATPASWNTITLDAPLYIDGYDIWVGYWLRGTKASFIPGVDGGPHNPNGDWIAAGPGWSHLSDNPDLDFNWNIRAYLQGNPIVQWLTTDPSTGKLIQDEFIDVDVIIDASNLDTSNAYNAQLIIRNSDPANSSVLINVEAVVGIDENGNLVHDYILLYPNPVNDFLVVTTNGNIRNIRILNNVGQVLVDSPMNGSNARINTGNFDAGIYFIQVETENGTSTKKFIVE